MGAMPIKDSAKLLNPPHPARAVHIYLDLPNPRACRTAFRISPLRAPRAHTAACTAPALPFSIFKTLVFPNVKARACRPGVTSPVLYTTTTCGLLRQIQSAGDEASRPKALESDLIQLSHIVGNRTVEVKLHKNRSAPIGSANRVAKGTRLIEHHFGEKGGRLPT